MFYVEVIKTYFIVIAITIYRAIESITLIASIVLIVLFETWFIRRRGRPARVRTFELKPK